MKAWSKQFLLGVVAACLLFPLAGVAKAGQGDVEIGFQLGGNGAIGEQVLPMVLPYFAVYLNNDLSFGGSFLYETGSIKEEGGDIDYKILGIEGVARYHIRLDSKSKYLPFIEGGVRYYSYELEDVETKFSSFLFGGGVKYEIYKDVFTNMKVTYSTGEVGGVDTSAFRISAGISVRI